MHRFSPDRLSDKQLRVLARRYRAGENIAQLAKENGYTWAGLHAALKRVGVKKFRGPGTNPRKIQLNDPRVIEAFRLRDNGMGYVEAAAKVGLASTTLRRLLVESGRDPARYWRGKEAKAWKGGRQRNADGYVRIHADELTEPMAGKRDGMVLEHRAVMAHYLDRPLDSYESVHHKNGNRDDNRLENLQLRNGKHGQGHALVCADCGSHNIVSAELD